MKMKRLIALLVVFGMSIVMIAGCGTGGSKGTESTTVKSEGDQKATTEEVVPTAEKGDNKGRPYNQSKTKYDTRDDRYLNGINATKLPITEKPVKLIIWRGFNSNVMQGLDESEFFKELEKRTGVQVEFVYPPVGQETDNFNLKIASDDLPHIFSTPPVYAGGYQKAVEDDVYLELTSYYDKGLMPNIKWLRETNKEINRDIVDDEGHMYFFPMIDIVPSDPWSGLWVREDWVKELGMELPKTIDDWDKMLRGMKAAKKVAPLAIDITKWYGVATNYAFAGSFETGYSFIQKEGKVVYGPIDSGYNQFLSKMNEWYKDGLIDPDFATRDYDSYNANIANGKIGAAGLAYGELGQIKLTGMNNEANFKLTPVLQPTSYNGQEIHLHQDNATVRGDREYFTTRLKDDGLDEIAVKWKDYWYSQDGGDLASYGPEGVSYKWNSDGKVEWIYPRLKNDEGLDFWTIFPLFKVHNWGYLRDSTAYKFESEVFECIQLWDTQDSSGLIPDNISLTTAESKELNNIMTDINTYRDEMTLKFIMGQEPLSNFNNYVGKIKGMNIERAIEIQAAAVDRYYKRK
jgi:putative aldouronate transport system substrate-binding protein